MQESTSLRKVSGTEVGKAGCALTTDTNEEEGTIEEKVEGFKKEEQAVNGGEGEEKMHFAV